MSPLVHDPVKGGKIMNHGREAILEHGLHVVPGEEAAHHEYGRGDAALPQFYSLIDGCNTQIVRVVLFESAGRLYCTAMAAMTLEVYYRYSSIYSKESVTTAPRRVKDRPREAEAVAPPQDE